MATISSVQKFGQDWNWRTVLTFNGQYDTNISNGADYETISLADIFTMEPGKEAKGDGPAFIPSAYHDYDGRVHARQREAGAFVALCVDIDAGDHALAHVESLTRGFCQDSAWLIYASANARPGNMRWRVIIPLAEPASFDAWHDAQHALSAFFEAAGVEVDRAMDRAAQPVYLPNVPEFHAKTGDRLRGENGAPLYYARATTGCNAPGLDTTTGPIAVGIAAIRRKQAEDDRERERIRKEAETRRLNAPKSEGAPIIEEFNKGTTISTLFELYGYAQSPRNADDWRSPHQTSDSYATRVIGDKWISLSASDVGARLGENFKAGCFGDAYDLFVHFEHSGDHKSAFRTLYSERRAATMPALPPPPPAQEGDPGWIEPPEGADAEATPDEAFAASIPAGDAPVDSLGFDIREWSTGRYSGEAPPIQWLCDNTIPLGVPALFAAMGGVGKSFIALDLGLEIAAVVGLGYTGRRILGGEVLARGSVVVLNAEDSKDSIHRRLERIDPDNRRGRADGRLFIVPMPEVGGPMPLITGDRGEFRKTEKFEALITQLKAIPDLKLIIIDPLQAFVTADITKDPAAGQYMWSAFAQLCASTGATVIACHHMRKEGMTKIDSSDAAREAIRGSTALIDGARATYALWGASEDHGRRVCAEAGVEHQPKRVVNGAVVKANDEHDWEVHTYLRADSGLLEDKSEIGRNVRTTSDRMSEENVLECLEEINRRWLAGNPFSASANAPERYLPNWIQRNFTVSKKTAKEHLEEWCIGLMIGTEQFDAKSKKAGLKVLKWPK